MNLPRFSVRRPVLTAMVTAIVVVLGAVSLRHVMIDMLPDVEMPNLTVVVDYPGASPEIMEQRVTQILEEIVATVPGVEQINSSSSEGRSRVGVGFAWGTDVDTAALDLKGRLEDERNELPDEVTPPRVRKFDLQGQPVVLLGVLGDLDPVDLTELISDQLRYRFGRVPGVAQVDMWGEYRREVRVELDSAKIDALQIPLNQVLGSIRSANLDLPAGRIEEGKYVVTLRAPAQFRDLDQLRHTVIDVREGAPVTVEQVGRVLDTYQKPDDIERINGRRGIRVAIRKQGQANTVEVSKAILEEVEAINAAFSQIQVVPVRNQGGFIERSIDNVARSVLYGGGLAILVLLVFLRNLRSTFVISLAIPISVVATFALIYFGGFTLNLMTLGGLALGVGMMVDNSIVVLENIFRRRDEEGDDEREAAVRGAVEVGPAIVASTITTLVVFLPVIFTRGVAGLLFQELAYVIIFSLICSLAVALSVVPMLASLLIRPASSTRPVPAWVRGVAQRSAAALERLTRSYVALLEWALERRVATVAVAATLLGASLLLVRQIGTEYIPPTDEGEIRVNGEMEVGTRPELVDRQTQQMEQIVTEMMPDAIAVMAESRSGGGSLQISLPPAAQRELSNVELADALRARLGNEIAGMEIRVRAQQGQFMLQRLLRSGSGNGDALQVEVRGYDLQTLERLAASVEQALSGIPGLIDVEASRRSGRPETELSVDRAKAAALGLSVRDVAEAIQTAVAGTAAGEYRSEGNSYRILVQLAAAEQLSIDQVLDLTLSTPTGERVALRNVATHVAGRGPTQIDRRHQQRFTSVSGNIVDRDPGSVAADVSAALARLPRPAGYDLVVTGSYEEQQESFRELAIAMLLSLLLVYMVMAGQYESLRDPLVVMCSVPVAAVGVIAMLLLTGTTLNVQSYIGCIMLGGIVVNNAILIVDQSGRLKSEGWSARDAVSEAGRRRLRPILMTTLTTLLGLAPLALGIGEGADAQAPLARAVIGGLIASTLVSLVLIPVVYTLFHPEPRSADADLPIPAPAVSHPG